MNSTPKQISAFSVTSDGALHAVPGSPFSGPNGSLVATSAYVFATDGKSIQTYTRGADGSLAAGSSIDGTAHNDTPEGSGVGTLTLDRTRSTLYAGEYNFQGADNDAFAVFNVGPSGTLSFNSNSPISVNYGAMLFSEDNRFAYGCGCYFINWDVWGLARGNDGSLTSIETHGDSPIPSNPETIYCPGPLAISATGYLAVGVRDISTPAAPLIAIYRIGADGALTLLQNSVLATNFRGLASVSFDPTGKILAAAGLSTLQLYGFGNDGVLTPLGAPQKTTSPLYQLEWDNAGHLYASTGKALYIFNVGSNGLSPVSGTPFPVSGSMALVPTT